MSKILVIDDERSIRNTLKDILEYEDYKIDLAKDGLEGLDLLKKNKYDIVLCDIKMPQMDGIEVLKKINEFKIDATVIMISGHGDVHTAVEAMKIGAFDFIEKPLDLNSLLLAIKNGMDKSQLISNENITNKKAKIKTSVEMIGTSASIEKVKNMIEKVASTEARVLITGDNGTGKELVARWLHEKSHRAKKQFIEVNCAAIPSELIESELFGHEKGAFTSAHKQRKGKFEQADGGTLFLDEIGDMSLSAQAKVLRALQEHKISRVGSDKEINVNVRILTATNKDLKKEIAKNNFREDLYHRLSVILIKVPKLNERKEDIPLLAEYFIFKICEDYKTPIKEISPEAIIELQKINWTGNIREFRNVMERLIILCEKKITSEDVVLFAQPLGENEI